MYEIRKITEAYKQFSAQENTTCALATVVNLKGSGYRRPGAKMLLTDKGQWVGAISGGCLEGDALRKTRQIIQEKKPKLLRYDTMNDQDAQQIGIGLGCNGVLDVLIEPLEPNHWTMQQMENILQQKTPTLLAHFFIPPEFEPSTFEGWQNAQFSFHPEKGFLENNCAWLTPNIKEEAKNIYQQQKNQTIFYENYALFYEIILPDIELYIFGGGYDIIPLTQMAQLLGWQTIIAEECPAHLIPKNFPNSQLINTQTHTLPPSLTGATHQKALLMSHNYKYDLKMLQQLLKTPLEYIGILGPKKRFEKMRQELLSQNTPLSPEDEQRIHSPIGLDLGAETPEEIALAIIAEIQSHHKKTNAIALKNKQGSIHSRNSFA